MLLDYHSFTPVHIEHLKMVHILKNPDGTVNMENMKKETDFLKG